MKSLQGSQTAPIFGLQTVCTYHMSLSWQHGRATPSWQIIQSSSHGIWEEGWLSAFNPVFQ